jgi:hypothetical protein
LNGISHTTVFIKNFTLIFDSYVPTGHLSTQLSVDEIPDIIPNESLPLDLEHCKSHFKFSLND